MDDRRKAAIRRLRARRGFRQHLKLWGDALRLALHGWRAPRHGFLHAYGERPISEAEIQREMKKGDAAYPPEP